MDLVKLNKIKLSLCKIFKFKKIKFEIKINIVGWGVHACQLDWHGGI